MKSLIIATIICISASLTGYSQSLITPFGGSYQSETYRINFSLGEMAIHTFESESYVLTQGFHQPFYSPVRDTSTSIALQKLNTGQDYRVFPNPSDGLFNLEFSIPEGEAMIRIYHINGGLIYTNKIAENDRLMIDLRNQLNGMYIMRIDSENTQFIEKLIIQ